MSTIYHIGPYSSCITDAHLGSYTRSASQLLCEVIFAKEVIEGQCSDTGSHVRDMLSLLSLLLSDKILLRVTDAIGRLSLASSEVGS